MDKTVKIRVLGEVGASAAAPSHVVKETNIAAELAKKEALLEDEKSKSLELLKTIVQLRESLKQEQAKTELAAKNKGEPCGNELAVKEAQLEEEKIRSLENLKTIVQLRESLKQEQAKSAEMFKIVSEQEAKAKEQAAADAAKLANKATLLQEAQMLASTQLQSIENLSLSLKQEQAKVLDLENKVATLDGNLLASQSLETNVKNLSEALAKITVIAAEATAK